MGAWCNCEIDHFAVVKSVSLFDVVQLSCFNMYDSESCIDLRQRWSARHSIS